MRSVSLSVFAMLFISACGEVSRPMVVCPKPPSLTVPAAETLAVGESAHFRVPSADLVHTPPRGILWSSSDSRVAAVNADSGVARAAAAGLAEISGVDQNSPVTCRDVWVGHLVVR